MPRLDPPRPGVPALRLRREAPRRPPLRIPTITDDTDTPKRPAAARRFIPASTAANARLLKSIDSGLPISLPPIPASGTENQNQAALGIWRVL
jgi:hypothetical protein